MLKKGCGECIKIVCIGMTDNENYSVAKKHIRRLSAYDAESIGDLFRRDRNGNGANFISQNQVSC